MLCNDSAVMGSTKLTTFTDDLPCTRDETSSSGSHLSYKDPKKWLSLSPFMGEEIVTKVMTPYKCPLWSRPSSCVCVCLCVCVCVCVCVCMLFGSFDAQNNTLRTHHIAPMLHRRKLKPRTLSNVSKSQSW